jgi:hypothetical protein
MTPLPMAIPGTRPSSRAALAERGPTNLPGVRYCPFCLCQLWIFPALFWIYHPIDTPYSAEIVFTQFFQSDFGEEILLPPFDAPIDADGHVSLFTDRATEASTFFTSGHVRQSIDEIIEFAA